MSSDFRILGWTDLEVGQWIQFFTSIDLSEVPTEQKNIYQQNQRFLVISREADVLEACYCRLIDIAGQSYRYSSNMHSLNGIYIWPGKIRVVSQDDVESIHGIETVKSVHKAAQKHIEMFASYFAKYPAQVLNQDFKNRIINKATDLELNVISQSLTLM